MSDSSRPDEVLLPPAQPDPDLLVEIVQTRMPFGRYAGRPIKSLPEAYLVWMSQKGFPSGRLGQMLETVLVMKHNGLMGLLEPIERMIAQDRGNDRSS